MKKLIFLLFCVGCSGAGGGSSTASNKNLFSIWQEVGGSNLRVDLTGGTFGAGNFQFATLTGNVCLCNVNLSGSQTTGAYTFSACAYDNGTGTGSDPGCAALDTSGTYTKTSTTLTTCDSGGCYNYN